MTTRRERDLAAALTAVRALVRDATREEFWSLTGELRATMRVINDKWREIEAAEQQDRARLMMQHPPAVFITEDPTND